MTKEQIKKAKKDFIRKKQPESYEWKYKLSQQKRAKMQQSDHTMTEHTRRLKHLNDHLKDLGSWQHRKKNPCDPLANPVWFFKGKNRDPDLEKALDLTNYDK